jgi:hypothetical protein
MLWSDAFGSLIERRAILLKSTVSRGWGAWIVSIPESLSAWKEFAFVEDIERAERRPETVRVLGDGLEKLYVCRWVEESKDEMEGMVMLSPCLMGLVLGVSWPVSATCDSRWFDSLRTVKVDFASADTDTGVSALDVPSVRAGGLGLLSRMDSSSPSREK